MEVDTSLLVYDLDVLDIALLFTNIHSDVSCWHVLQDVHKLHAFCLNYMYLAYKSSRFFTQWLDPNQRGSFTYCSFQESYTDTTCVYPSSWPGPVPLIFLVRLHGHIHNCSEQVLLQAFHGGDSSWFIESTKKPSSTVKSNRTTLHYITQDDSTHDLVLPPGSTSLVLPSVPIRNLWYKNEIHTSVKPGQF